MQHNYYLTLPNIQGIPYSAQELRAIVEQRMPCGTFSITARDAGDPSQLLGSGTYTKLAAVDCYIQIVKEEGICRGLMAVLFPERPLRAVTSPRGEPPITGLPTR
jgi:hypothetical protein